MSVKFLCRRIMTTRCMANNSRKEQIWSHSKRRQNHHLTTLTVARTVALLLFMCTLQCIFLNKHITKSHKIWSKKRDDIYEKKHCFSVFHMKFGGLTQVTCTVLTNFNSTFGSHTEKQKKTNAIHNKTWAWHYSMLDLPYFLFLGVWIEYGIEFYMMLDISWVDFLSKKLRYSLAVVAWEHTNTQTISTTHRSVLTLYKSQHIQLVIIHLSIIY